MLSVELCGSASTFKFENLDDFEVDFGHFCQFQNFESYLFAQLITSKSFLLPALDKGIVG